MPSTYQQQRSIQSASLTFFGLFWQISLLSICK